MASTFELGGQHQDWCTGFHDDQSPLLDPPALIAPRTVKALAPVETLKARSRHPALASFVAMLCWIVSRPA